MLKEYWVEKHFWKNVWVKNKTKYCWVWKDFGSENFYGCNKISSLKKFASERNLLLEHFDPQKLWHLENLVQEICSNSYLLKVKIGSVIAETSSAGSAKLGYTSWDKLTTEVISWNFPDSQLCLESKVATTQNYKDTAQKKCTLVGGTPHIFSW